MKKYTFLLMIGCWFAVQMYAQDPVLLRIGDETVSRTMFERAYNKYKDSHPNQLTSEYLDEFINERLKIAEAKTLKLDDEADFQTRIQAYRKKLSVYFLTGQQSEDAVASYNLNQNAILITQIFKYLPQNDTSAAREAQSNLMSLLHSELHANPHADFSEYVAKHSDDKRCIEVTRMQVTPEFERVVFALQKGEVSAPFYTPSGIHIVKVLDENVQNTKDHSENLHIGGNLKENYAPSLQKLKDICKYTPNQSAINELVTNGQTTGVLFTLDGESYTGTDFALFAEGNPKGIRRQFDGFVTKTLFDYADTHLEEQYPDVGFLLQEYHDALLLSEITQRNIIEKIQTDRAGLIAYFSVNKKKYRWEQPRFRGAVLYSQNKKALSGAKKLIKKKPVSQWKELIDAQFNTDETQVVKIEQGIFAVGDNSFIDAYVFKAKSGYPVAVESYPFAAVVGKKVKGPEHYEEVLTPLVADYQEFLEERWLSRLHDTYNVEIDEEVLKTVNNH